MNNKNTILLIAVALIVGVLMPFISRFSFLFIQCPQKLPFLIESFFSYKMVHYFLMLGVFNLMPFIILSILFVAANRMKAKVNKLKTEKSQDVYHCSLKVSLLYGCYVLVSSVYLNISDVVSSMNGVSNISMHALNLFVMLFGFLFALIVIKVAIMR